MPNFITSPSAIAEHLHEPEDFTLRNLVMTISDSLTISDDVVKSEPLHLRAFSDAVTLTASESRLTTRTRTISDTVTLTHSNSITRNKVRAFSEVTLNFSSLTSRLTNKIRTIADTLSLTAPINKYASKNRSSSDSLTLTSSLQRTTNRLRSHTPALTLVDSMNRYRYRPKTISDSLTLSSTVIKIRNKIRSFSDSLTLSDSPYNQVRNKWRSITDSLTLTDSSVKSKGKWKTISDGLRFLLVVLPNQITGTMYIHKHHYAFIPDPNSNVITDSILRITGRTRSFNDSVNITSTTNKTANKNRSISDSISFSDSSTGSKLKFRGFDDFLILVDSRNRLLGKIRTISDNLTLISSNSKITTRLRTLSVSLSLISSVSVFRSFNKSISDTLSFISAHSRITNRIKTISDSLTLSHTTNILRNKIKLISQSLTLSDSYSRITTRLRTISDSLAFSDTMTYLKIAKIPRLISDSISFTDNITELRGKWKTISEVLVFNANQPIQTRNKYRTILPTLTLSHTTARIKNKVAVISETLTLTASMSRSFILRLITILEFMTLNDSLSQQKTATGATRLYLHAAATPQGGSLPGTPQSTQTYNANIDSIALNRSMTKAISVTTQTDLSASRSVSSPYKIYVTRFVSPPLGQSSIAANTWTVNFGAYLSSASTNYPARTTGNFGFGSDYAVISALYVWRPSTGLKVGTIFDGESATYTAAHGQSSEKSVNITFTGSAVTGIQIGDVLIFEQWAYTTTTTTYTYHYCFDGSVITTTDNTATTNHAAFIQTPESLILGVNRSFTRTIADTVTFSSSNTFVRNKFRQIADNLTLGSTITKELVAKIRYISDSVILNHFTNRYRGFTKTITGENITLTHTTNRLFNKIRTILPSLTLSDISTRARYRPRSISSAITLTHTTIRERVNLIRYISASLTLTDISTRMTTRLKSISHLLTLSDTRRFDKGFIKYFTDNFTVSDSSIQSKGKSRTFISLLTFSSSNTWIGDIRIKQIIHNLNLNESVGMKRYIMRYENAGNLNINDTMSRYRMIPGIINDSLTFSSSMSRIKNKWRKVYETLTLSSVATRGLVNITKSFFIRRLRIYKR